MSYQEAHFFAHNERGVAGAETRGSDFLSRRRGDGMRWCVREWMGGGTI